MENSPTVIRPPPPPQPPPSIFPPSPFPPPDNATANVTNINSPPPPLPFFQPLSPQIYPTNQGGNIVNINQSPPFPDSPSSVDLSPLEFILALLAVITIPALVYAFFFAVKCPPWSSASSSSSREHDETSSELPRDIHGSPVELIERRREPVSGVKYQKDTHSKEIGSDCPVCLCVFADGEEVKQLKECKHSFHATCIDLWLNNHNNCPVCRASVAVKKPNGNNNRTAPPGPARNRNDLHQGLPDAASLV